MRGFPPRFGLLAAVLLLAACKPSANVPAPPGPAAPPPPAADVAWDPEDLKTLPGEEAALPGSGTTFLEGVVVDPAGKPVPGATVEMHAFPRVDSAAIPVLHATATAGADGRFRVGPGPTPWWEQGVLSARAPGFARTTLRGSAVTLPGEPFADEGVEARIVLRPGIPVRGEVRGEDGGPPDGPVVVWVLGRHFHEIVPTDAAGDFAFVAPAGRCTVHVMDGVHPRAREMADVAAGAENRVRIRVRRGSDVRGRVVDAATGRPVPGAVLRGYWGDNRIVRAGPDGAFLMPRYWFKAFQVRAPGYEAKVHVLPEERGPDPLTNEVVRLERGFTARGRVTGPDGKPVAGVRMRLFLRGPSGDWTVISGPATKSDGAYVFVGLPLPTREREVRVFATGEGWAVGATAPLSGAAGAVVDGADVRLVAVTEVVGRVEDEHGAPAPGTISIEWDLPKGLETYRPLIPGSAVLHSGDDGGFRARVPEGATVRVRAESPLFLPGTGEAKAPGPVAVKVFRGLLLKGRVVDSVGYPLTRGNVHVTPNPPGDARPTRDAAITEEGTFEVGGLVDDAYDLSLSAAPEFLHEATRDLRPGGDPVTIRARRPGGVSGRLVLPEGAPPGLLPEVTVRALGDSRPFPPVMTRRIATADRRFGIGPLVPGTYAFSAVAGDWRVDVEKVDVKEAPGTEMGDVVLVPAGVVAGTVRLLGKPAPGVPFEVLRVLPGGGAETTGKGETGPDGRYRVGGLRSGAHLVAVRAKERPVVEARFEASPGAPAALDVEVPAGAGLAVTVLGADGKPAPGARVTISGPAGGLPYWKEGSPRAGSACTGTDGVLRCRGLPAGDLRVSVSLPGGGSGEASVKVADGSDGAVEVRLAK